MHTRRTLQLDHARWDITLDGTGRIALAVDDAATAQNVANEARLFTNDAYFDQDRGIPHFAVELGQRVHNALLRSHLRRAALRVPDVKDVLSVEITGFDQKNRELSGDIRFTTVAGAADTALASYF